MRACAKFLRLDHIIMVIGLTTYKSVNGFTDEQLDLMKAFLQGAVYCWYKNRKDEWFAARDLLGGDNYYWQGTPPHSAIRILSQWR